MSEIPLRWQVFVPLLQARAQTLKAKAISLCPGIVQLHWTVKVKLTKLFWLPWDMVECDEKCFKGNSNVEYLMNICQQVPKLQIWWRMTLYRKKQSLQRRPHIEVRLWQSASALPVAQKNICSRTLSPWEHLPLEAVLTQYYFVLDFVFLPVPKMAIQDLAIQRHWKMWFIPLFLWRKIH